MPRPKGNKNFMTLSQKECLTTSKRSLENAEGSYRDALLLAKNKSYGRAISILIISSEETMKAFILFLDGNGFQFRKNVKGINNLFVNHSLRYALAFVLSVLQIFSDDLDYFLQKARNDQKKLISLSKDKEALSIKIMEYFKRKVENIRQEVNWFSDLGYLREEGFYVDFVDEIKTPMQIDEKKYNDVLIRLNNMRTFMSTLIDSIEEDNESLNNYLEQLKKRFLNEDWYQKIGELIQMFRDRKTNPFQELSNFIDEVLSEIEEQKPLTK